MKKRVLIVEDDSNLAAFMRENLLYARPDATEEEIVAAARAANIHEFIESLPDGERDRGRDRTGFKGLNVGRGLQTA